MLMEQSLDVPGNALIVGASGESALFVGLIDGASGKNGEPDDGYGCSGELCNAGHSLPFKDPLTVIGSALPGNRSTVRVSGLHWRLAVVKKIQKIVAE
jgi:hypothetical protein